MNQQFADLSSLFETLADAAGDAIVIGGARDLVIVYANRAAHRLFGCDPDRQEMLGQDGRRFWPAQDLPVLEALLPAVLTKAWTGDVRQRRLDGQVFDANATVFAIPDDAGGAALIVAMIRDISGRKRTEEALTLTQFAMDRSADAVFLIDASARFLYVNDAVCAGLGYSRDELLTMRVPDIDPDVPLALFHVLFEQLRHEGRQRFEARHRRKDGSMLAVEVIANYLIVAGKEYNCCFVRDISERKAAELALRQSEARFRSVVSNTPVLIFEFDEDGIFRLSEGRGLKALGLRPGQLVGTPIGDFLGPAPEVAMSIERAIAGEQTRLTARVGSRVFETCFNPVEDPRASHRSVIGVAMDITERIEHESELRQKTDELTRFTYTVSHDLKSPLVTIRTFLGFLEQDLRQQDMERIARDMEFIGKAAERMTRLLDELLELSRIGRVVNVSTEFSLQEVMGEVLDLVAGRLVSRGVAVQVTDTPVRIQGDRPRLIEVFQNLIDNAVKFMGPQANPLIRVTVEEAGSGLIFAVADNGIGIDPRHAHKVFGLFEQLDPAVEGTGIGLTLVKRIIEVHGGHIWVDSPGQGVGTTFRFSLPGARLGDR